jgi:adenylate cyclase
MLPLIEELKRRNVFKVAAAYAAVAWMFLELSALALNAFSAPAWVMKVIIFLVVAGFAVAVLLAWAFELTPEGIKRTVNSEEAPALTLPVSGKLTSITISALALALLLVVVDSYVIEDASPVPVAPPVLLETSATDLGVIPEKSIAVLPFVDLSENKDQEYFTDGLSEELLNRLARVQDLQVAARTSSFYFKGRNEDMRTIGEQLGVAYILEGSVRKASESLRITTQLVRAADGFQVFSESYDRTLEDIFAIQEEIAQAVTTTLSVSLAAGEFNRPGMTRNVQAYEAYLQRNVPGADDLQVIDALKQAVDIDPEFALAWNALYQAYERSTVTLPADVSADFNAAKLEALQRTGALIPDSPEYLVSHAMSERRQAHWQEAEQLFLQVLTKFGNSDAMANFNYGNFLWAVGRVREAVPYLERAKRLDPKDVGVANRLGNALFSVGESEAGLAEAERGIALAPQDGFARSTYLSVLLGLGEFGRVLEKMQQDDNESPHVLQLMQALQAREEDATAVPAALDNLRTVLAGGNLSPGVYTALGAYVAIAGDADYALTLYSAAADGNLRDIFGALPTWAPYMSDMRKLPGFKDLARDAGLVDYWRTTGNWSDYCRPVNDDFECF